MPSFSFILLMVLRRILKNNVLKIYPYITLATNRKDLVTSHMKLGELLNNHFCKRIKYFPMRQQKLPICTFPNGNYKFPKQQRPLDSDTKNIIVVEGNVLSMYAKFQLYHPYGF